MKIKTKTLLWLFIPSVIMATIVTTFYFFHTRNALEQSILNKLEMAADELHEHVQLFLKMKKRRVIDYCSDGLIRDYTEKITRKEKMRELHTTSLNRHLVTNKKSIDPGILDILIIDFDGKVIASTDESSIGEDKSKESYFTETKFLGAFAGRPCYDARFKAIVIDFSTILLSKISREAIGIIVNRIKFEKQKDVDTNNALFQQADVLDYTVLVSVNKARIMDFSSDGFIRDCTEKLTRSDDMVMNNIDSLNTYLVDRKQPLDKEIMAVFVMGLNGIIIGSSEFGLLGKDVSGEDYFTYTMKYGSYIGDLHRKPGAEHNIIEVSRLLLSRDGMNTIGVLVNRYNVNSFNQITRSGILEELGQDKLLDGLGDTGELYIVNRGKLMITGSRFIKNAILNQVVDTEGVRSTLDNSEGMTDIYNGYRGVSVIGASKYLEEMDWVVLAEKDVSEAFAPILQLRNFAIIVGIISIIIIVVIVNFLASGITKTIRMLTEGTRRIAKGNLDYRIKTRSRDEIGYLASSFNDMTIKLGKSKKQLQDYAENLEKMVEDKTRVLKNEIANRKNVEKQITASLKEKEVLLKEVHHRVKNNMQIISSLISLQSRQFKDEKLIAVFDECKGRIKAMAQIHEELYNTKDFANVDFSCYIRTLADRLVKSYVIHPDRILLDINIDGVFLDVETSIPSEILISRI